MDDRTGHSYDSRAKAIAAGVPAERAMPPCPECSEADRVWAVGDGRYRCAACDVGWMPAAAPPAGLVEAVRRWVISTQVIRLAPDPTPEMLREHSEATFCLLAFPLPAPTEEK